MRDVWCPACQRTHGRVAEHPYDPDPEQSVDPIAGQRPCRECGRFEGSYLHRELRR